MPDPVHFCLLLLIKFVRFKNRKTFHQKSSLSLLDMSVHIKKSRKETVGAGSPRPNLTKTLFLRVASHLLFHGPRFSIFICENLRNLRPHLLLELKRVSPS